jgi:DUF1680 family protein
MRLTVPICLAMILATGLAQAAEPPPSAAPVAALNLAEVARVTASFVAADTTLAALNDGQSPQDSADVRHGAYSNWPRPGTQWVQYSWSQPIHTKEISVYWWDDHQGVRLPKACQLKYWNGTNFVAVKQVQGLGVVSNQFNVTTFEEAKTTKLRLEMTGEGGFSTGLLEWRVLDAGQMPDFPPRVQAGIDRTVMVGGKTYLNATVKYLKPGQTGKMVWSKDSGPGQVTFADAHTNVTTATFSKPGDYGLQLKAGEGSLSASDTLKVKAVLPPPAHRLEVVYPQPYRIDSPLWNARTKALIVNWIPHCVDQINRTSLPHNQGDGGLDNFIEAAKALRGEPHGPHRGDLFADARVHQTVEAMCLALMVEAPDDPEILAAQLKMKATLEDWIPKILAAQEPDGCLQTAYTLADRSEWPSHWNPAQRDNYEGYVMGAFIESAISHYTLTGGADKHLYNAAKKVCDAWVANIGPGKQEWFDGHQQMEQALVRFGRFVNDTEANGGGDNYIALAKFLLDCRKNGSEYDQSHLPVPQQYEAVGHAVRAADHFSALADVAAETHDADYQSAVRSLCDNLINQKYSVTGGMGGGENPEELGPAYSLPNEAGGETCASCGLISFQWKMNLAYHDATYADLYEETIFNALLGSLDLDGKNFYRANPLVEDKPRYPWSGSPCCVGNIPRTLLLLPTWAYAKATNAIYVNLFIGGSVPVGRVAGTDVEMVQKTDYPWSGQVSITVNPNQPKRFTVFVRVPNRTTSALYTSSPEVKGVRSLAVNGKQVSAKVDKGYVAITREWRAGDSIDLDFPMAIQVVKADERVKADRGRIALRYGPLIYTFESADQPRLNLKPNLKSLMPEWRGEMLGGVMVITGKWSDDSPLLAVPYYARQNRGGKSTVWIQE